MAILDLSPTGAQPMATIDGRFWITYNGEVYNFRELRSELESQGHQFRSSSDTEVVLAAYAAWGGHCLDRLNGMFALAIWDRTERTLFLARDRLGIKPLYWAEFDGGLAFASEAKAILATGLVSVRPDPEITHNPWHYPSAPRTGFLGVWKLPPGHVLTWRDGRTKIENWWRIPETGDHLTARAARDELERLLPDAVRLQMISDVPVGALLSGGLDSTCIVALMRRFTREPVRTISIRFRSDDLPFEAMPDDEEFAQAAARTLGCQHTPIQLSPADIDLLPKLVWHLDEPIFDPATINTFLVAREARRLGIVVLLSGMGADEIFGGYRKHLACLLSEKCISVVPRLLREGLESATRLLPVASSQVGFRYLRWVKRFAGIASLNRVDRFLQSDLSLGPGAYDRLFQDASDYPYDDLAEVRARRELMHRSGGYLDLMCRFDTQVYLPDHNLAYTDKATMAAGVEARPPFVDHRLVQLAFSLEDRDRIDGRNQKALLRSVASEWIPRRIARRPKASFAAPLRAWIRRDLREMVDDLLSESAVRARGLYRPSEVRRIIEADRRGHEDHAHLIWNLLNRELWFEAFVDGGGKALGSAREAAPAS